MELQQMFSNLHADWLRWSSYQLVERYGVPYLLPEAGAVEIRYSSVQALPQLLPDALNLGRLACHAPRESRQAAVDFAAAYGPLGITSPQTGPVRVITGGHTAPSSPQVTARDYAEPLEGYLGRLRLLYLHLALSRGEEPPTITPMDREELRRWESQPQPVGMHCRLTGGNSPQLVWEPESLWAVLWLGYSLAVVDPAQPLRSCKHCGGYYQNAHQRSEFCSVRCRNHYNVKAFRQREKDSSAK